MNKKIKIGIGFGTIILVMGLLFTQGLNASGGVGVYLTLEEALASEKNDNDRFIQMEADVIASSVKYDSSKPSLIFDLTDDKGNVINVKYYDIKPDNFDSGYPVIVEGRFAEGKEFVADKVLVKCPSKYEEEAAKQ